MTNTLIRDTQGKDSREDYLERQTDMAGIDFQAKECLEPPEVERSKGFSFALGPLEGAWSFQTLIFGLLISKTV